MRYILKEQEKLMYWQSHGYLIAVGRLPEGDGSIEEAGGKVHDSGHKLPSAARTLPPSLSGHSKKSCCIRCCPVLDTCSQGMKVVTNQAGTVCMCRMERVVNEAKYYHLSLASLNANIPLLLILFIILPHQASWNNRKPWGYYRTRRLKRNRQSNS